MILHDCTAAPSPRRVRMFLAEKGIQIEMRQVDLSTGEQFSAEYKKLNPLSEVPLLELDDGTCITQINAICRYFEELHPENPLFGRTPIERALVESADHQLSSNGLMAVAEAFRNTTPGFKNRAMPGPHDYEQIPELTARGLLRLDNLMHDLNSHFAKSQFVTGDYFSVADITGFITIDFARWVKKFIPEDHTDLQRWYDEVKSRPSAKA